MKKRIMRWLCGIVMLTISSVQAQKVYNESGGLVVMEAENTDSPLGNWDLRAPNAVGYPAGAGDGHLEFRGGGAWNVPHSPLVYTFKINQGGTYHLNLRSHKRLNPGDGGDKHNDCFVRMEGDFESGNPNAAKAALLDDGKLYGGDATTWGRAKALDHSLADHTPAIYAFKAGETYTFTVSGRSTQYNLDRIIFYHDSVATPSLAQLGSLPESGLDNMPTANAGADQMLDLPISATTLPGSGADGGSIVSYSWAQVSGPNAATLSGQSTTELSASGLVEGNYVFRLTVTDDDGLTDDDDVTVRVREPSAAVDLIDEDWSSITLGDTTGINQPISDGSYDAGLRLHNHIVGKIVSPNAAFTSASGNVLQVSTGTNPNGGWGLLSADNSWRPVALSEGQEIIFSFDAYVITAPEGAGSITLQVKLEGGTSVTRNFTEFTGASAGDLIHVAWTNTITASMATATAVSPQIAFEGLVGNYSTTGPNSNGTAVDVMQLDNIKLAFTSDGSGPSPLDPTADAGDDQVISLPTSQITLLGSGTDNGTIVSYSWTQVSGPSTATLAGAATANLTTSSLMAGTYVFSLTVTDNEGQTGSDVVSVRVAAEEKLIYAAITDFPVTDAGEVPYTVYAGKNALGINAANAAYREKFARAETTFVGTSGTYDVTITALKELDGECTYRLLVNGVVVASAQNDETTVDYQPQDHVFEGITIPAGATLAVESDAVTNGKIPEGNITAYARGRWTTLTLAHAVGDVISGERRIWHKITLALDGPEAAENATPNPFSDYRMDVTFTHPTSGKTYTVPGYFAADGNAAHSGATSGNKWFCHFRPDKSGSWNYNVSFRQGSKVAVGTATSGSALAPYDGANGSFDVSAENPTTAPDLRSKGRLRYVGKHHLQFEGNGEYFLKFGLDSPENFLEYYEFDNTPVEGNKGARHNFTTHAQHYNNDGALWQGTKGKNILGAVNYIASTGANSISMLLNNIGRTVPDPNREGKTLSAPGDGARAFPFISKDVADRERYDCSKLAQWEMVFDHAEMKGLYLHFKLAEIEMARDLDGGQLGNERRLYYREMIARFGHHLALNWNISEEIPVGSSTRTEWLKFFEENDPWQNNRVFHTGPSNDKSNFFNPHLGDSELTGISLQTPEAIDTENVFNETKKWVDASAANSQPWIVACDEQGPGNLGVNQSFELSRKNLVWGNIMAGGAGSEFYSGGSDLVLDDYAHFEELLIWSDYAVNEFFYGEGIPFWNMSNKDTLLSGGTAHCLADDAGTYVVYLKNGGITSLNLTGKTGSFEVRWFDPRNGGELQEGSVSSVTAGSTVALGTAPSATTSDWAVLIRPQGLTSDPSANAGADQVLELPDSEITLQGSGSDDGSIVSYNWTQVSGPNDATLSGKLTPNLTASNLIKGDYVFSLAVTDDENLTDLDEVRVEVRDPAPLPTGKVYLEAGGLVVMEMEGTESVLGKWNEIPTDTAGYPAGSLGGSHLEYMGPFGTPNSPLEYTFKITKPGKYYVVFRAYKRLEGAAGDQHNDCFVKMAGDFTSGSAEVPLAALTQDTKLFGGWDGGWGRANKLDGNGAHLKDAVYELKAGETYTFTVSGRSNKFNLDRVVFYHEDNYSDLPDGTEIKNMPESQLLVSEAPIANAGDDQQINLPTSAVTLQGSGSDNGSIASYGWAQVSGPGTATLFGETTADLTASDLMAGSYVFNLTVTDNEGLTASDEVCVEVLDPNAQRSMLTTIWAADFEDVAVGTSSGNNQTLEGTEVQTANTLSGVVIATPAAFTKASGNVFQLTADANQYAALRPDQKPIDLTRYDLREGDKFVLSFDLYLPADLAVAVGGAQFRWKDAANTGNGSTDTSGEKMAAGEYHVEYLGTFPVDTGGGDFIPENVWPFIFCDQNGAAATNHMCIDNLSFKIGTAPQVVMPLYDAWAVEMGLAGWQANPTLDLDNDGFTNMDEFLSGFDPKNAFSIFTVESIKQPIESTGEMVISWESQPGRMYNVSMSTNLTSGAFTVIENDIRFPQNSATVDVSHVESAYLRVDVRVQ